MLLSDRLGDHVSDYTAEGKIYTAKKREQALNEANGNIYNAELAAIAGERPTDQGIQKFLNEFPSFRDEITFDINNSSPDTKQLLRVSRVRKYMTAEINADIPVIVSKVATALTTEQYQRALNNPNSNFKPSADNPKFYVKNKYISIEIGGTRNEDKIARGTVKFAVFLQPVYTAFDVNGEDIIAPEEWEHEIISQASLIAIANRQK